MDCYFVGEGRDSDTEHDTVDHGGMTVDKFAEGGLGIVFRVVAQELKVVGHGFMWIWPCEGGK